VTGNYGFGAEKRGASSKRQQLTIPSRFHTAKTGADICPIAIIDNSSVRFEDRCQSSELMAVPVLRWFGYHCVQVWASSTSHLNSGLTAHRADDFEKAVVVFRKAVDQGNVSAAYNLAIMYSFGQGVNKDYLKAHDWFYKAAKLGNVGATYSLGVMCNARHGVTENLEEAAVGPEARHAA
jgi:hypothetical protein